MIAFGLVALGGLLPVHAAAKEGIRILIVAGGSSHDYEPAPAGSSIEVLANSGDARTQALYPSVFVVKHSRARIVGITLGHDSGAHELPQYQQILRQAVEWAARRK